ncbi:ECF-type sigma factor [Dokdonella sp.]|uniref:ECF-type sigma factor n=1 Tax=Dokdonella sp. TaxID=2291710 RepID=UPI001B00F97C|nr:ECF-type sigma factor [Dokdonella sp.]MBO9662199.1 sigma-70 family RNA polymerase sigma factor [Dokdonella sp.]
MDLQDETEYETEIGLRLETLVKERALDLSALMTGLQNELRQIAHRQRRRGGVGETLSTTALVNEAYLKFASSPELFGRVDRNHFLAIAARAMRNIVINHARDRVAQKRGGGAAHETLGEVEAFDADLAEANRILELNDALGRLEQVRPRLAQVVQLRYFAGLSEEETGEVLDLDRSTVRRDWLKARGWLFERLHPDS